MQQAIRSVAQHYVISFTNETSYHRARWRQTMTKYSRCLLRNESQRWRPGSVRHWHFTYLQQKNKDKYTNLVKVVQLRI